ncbi:MAG: hypothetical protein ACRDT4_14510 [Micromonosporaceae bacterium]
MTSPESAPPGQPPSFGQPPPPGHAAVPPGMPGPYGAPPPVVRAAVPPAPLLRPVPPGPGVRPPFVAPPVQKAGGTLAIGLVLGGFALLLCLVGGGIGIGATLISAFQDTDEEARAAAAAYLDAIAEERYSEAYQMTCKPFREQVDEQEFVSTKQQDARIVDYQLSTMTAYEDKFMVPATVSLDGGGEVRVGLLLAREPVEGSGSGRDAETEFRVCGEVENPAPMPS